MSRSRYLTALRLGRTAGIAVTAAMACIAAAPALAAWSVAGAGGAAGAATTMPGGNTPSVAVTGSNIAVRWPAVDLP
jgi:hypothetical protein